MFEEVFVRSFDGCRLRLFVAGNGSKYVVFLHGWPGFWKDWEKVMPLLVNDCKMVVPDLRGFGLSDKPETPDRYTLDDYAGDVLSILSTLNIDRVVLSGFDVGSSVAAYFAKNHPNKVSKLILINPSYPSLGRKRLELEHAAENWYQFFHVLDLAEKLVGYNRDTVKIYLTHFYRHWSYRQDAFTEKDIEEYVDIYYKHGLKGGFNWYRARMKTRYGDWLKGPVTTLGVIVWSDRDPIFPLEWSHGAKDYFPNSELVTIRECGHFVPREAPSELASIIREHLL
ncbi:MAG: alpha/beta hydrolase [Candidatus Caldarchaeum sp.]